MLKEMRRKDREITDSSSISEIIEACDVCRLGFANDNYPYIVTLNFGYSGSPVSTLWFHCAPEGQKLEMMEKNNHVCFQMDTDHRLYGGDNGCDWGMNFSSVVGYGLLHKVEDADMKNEGLQHIMKHYSGKENHNFESSVFSRTLVLRLDIGSITAKKR